MTAPLTDDAIAELIKRLRERKDFDLFGSRWMMLTTPDKDCVAAAIELERLRAQPTYEASLRDALNEVVTNGEWTDGEQRGEWKISEEVYETARDALAAAQGKEGRS